MEILINAALLFGTAAALALLRIVRPQFRFGWLLAIAGTAGALAERPILVAKTSHRPEYPPLAIGGI